MYSDDLGYAPAPQKPSRVRCHECSQPIEEGQPLQVLNIGYMDDLNRFVPRVAHARPEDCPASPFQNLREQG